MTALDKFTNPPSKKRTTSFKTEQKSSKTKSHGFTFSIAGVHGVGKTTIYNIIAKNFEDFLNIRLYPERLRPIPPVPFGSKDKQIAFRSEIHYNQQMIERNQLARTFITNHRQNIAILDRTPISTIVYARALALPKIDYDLINDTYNSVDWIKDYVIYLEASPKEIMDRIYRRGSLDVERQKWNEEDYNYLIRVLGKYEDLFKELKLEKQGRLIRIQTENKTPKEVSEQIISVIEVKSGLSLRKKMDLPVNQATLTNWISES